MICIRKLSLSMKYTYVNNTPNPPKTIIKVLVTKRNQIYTDSNYVKIECDDMNTVFKWLLV